ncbi:2-acylglycerol O-acyltransferase 1-like isoform X1 [Oncorhynchus nerka]|nr:2-acylglycerol O-acyltransferase 1 isoform X1 [Oncorhynchus mykiss]XP_029537253.1 2-acylglycerol O-acyltransferase 1-like isoform X1 [Oncorhynchus nerka]XP_029629478.1 2-acylglycerol O-acyltransferase 1-like [Salmo trutta]
MVKIEFAPLNIPLNRRFQTAAVLQWVFCFLFGAQCCFCVYVVIVLNGYWHVAALYALWLYLDWDTPQAGGRRSDWVRHWTVWKHFGDYFPIHLIKTCDLDPERNYLMGFHPHGILVAGAFGNFCTEYTGFRELYPGMTPYLHTLGIWFSFPFFREYLMSSGVVSCSKKSLTHVLSQKGGGNVSIIVIGGAAESLEARPGSLVLEALNRKGFVKIALRCGAHLVPVFSFGENDLFNQLKNPKGSLVRTIQEGMRKTLGFSLPLFHARGVFQYSLGFMPFRQPIYTIVGEPIVVERNVSPSSDEVDRLHGCYLGALAKLFEQHKAEYGILENQHLIFT